MKKKITVSSTLVGIIIGGLSYWFQAYNELSVFGINIWVILGVGAFLGALILMLLFNQKPSKIALFVSFGVALAILARIIYDTTFWDSTSHNLAPFELIFACIIAVPSAFFGVYLVFLIRKHLM